MSSPSPLPNAVPVGSLFTVGKPNIPVVSVNGLQGFVLLTTTEIPEGTNLYFTAARVLAVVPVSSVNGKQGVVVLTTTDIAEGTNEYFTDARVLAVIATQPDPIDVSLMLMGG